MSTRGAYGFRVDDDDYIMYNHGDSYPSGLCADIMNDLRCLYKKQKKNYAIFIERCKKNVRKMEAIQEVFIDSKEFLSDSLFCEWAYIINFDEEVFEIYKGFNKDESAYGRYAKTKRDEYADVRLVATVPLKLLLTVKGYAKFGVEDYVRFLEKAKYRI